MPEIFKTSAERKETPKTIFMVAERGLETHIHEAVNLEEFTKRTDKDFESNLNWYKIQVADEKAKERWIALRNEWLKCSWTPNQDDETRVVVRETHEGNRGGTAFPGTIVNK